MSKPHLLRVGITQTTSTAYLRIMCVRVCNEYDKTIKTQ